MATVGTSSEKINDPTIANQNRAPMCIRCRITYLPRTPWKCYLQGSHKWWSLGALFPKGNKEVSGLVDHRAAGVTASFSVLVVVNGLFDGAELGYDAPAVICFLGPRKCSLIIRIKWGRKS